MEREKFAKTLEAQLHDEVWLPFVTRTQLLNEADENYDFYNGKQWGDYDPNDGFPRPVMNIISYGINQVSSKLNGTPIYFSYSASREDVDCSKLRQFDEYVCARLDLQVFSKQSLVNAYTGGTEITYLRWDEDEIYSESLYDGGLAIEHVDVRNFIVSDPSIMEIQKQEWIMFFKDVQVRAIKKIIDSEPFSDEEKSRRKKCLNRDDTRNNDDLNKDKDLLNSAYLRVYTRFFRIDGEVCVMCSTSNINIYAYPKPLSTGIREDYAKEAWEKFQRECKESEGVDADGNIFHDIDIDCSDLTIGDYDRKKTDLAKLAKKQGKFKLYPFAVFTPLPRANSFYGNSKAHALIPIQKAVNFAYGMVMQCAQNNAYSKVFVKDGALRDQVLTNDPGQVVVDYSAGINGWGIKMAESQPLPNDLIQFSGNVIDMASKLYNFSDVMGGQVTSENLSGYAVNQMIKQASTPLEQEQQLFWKYHKDLAYIRLMFYKHYVKETAYVWEYDDSELEVQEMARNTLLQGVSAGAPIRDSEGNTFTDTESLMSGLNKPMQKRHTSTFSGRELWGADFDIRIDVMQGLADSKLAEQQAWSEMIVNGGIANMDADTLEFVIKASPMFSPAFKNDIHNLITKKKYSELSMLKQQLAQQTQYIQQLEGQLGFASEYNKNLTNEFGTKINLANKVNSDLRQQMSANSGYAQQQQRGQEQASRPALVPNNSTLE